MGHTYTKNLFIVYAKFNVTGDPVFLFAKSADLNLPKETIIYNRIMKCYSNC